jgi:hypothetical protein
MEFQYYNPEKLVPILKERGVVPFFYRVCQGCVFTNIPPEDCIHDRDDFATPSVQSDTFCPHCLDTIEDSKEPFHLHDDKDLNKKVAELEKIIEMVFLENNS